MIISYKDWRNSIYLKENLDFDLSIIMENTNENETIIIKSLKKWASNILDKTKSVVTAILPDKKLVESKYNIILTELEKKYKVFSNENFPKEMLANFSFFDHAIPKNKNESVLGTVKDWLIKGAWAVLKWLFISLADLVNASLSLIRETLTEEGLFKICIFWVGPAILASPIMGLQSLYGISNLVGLTPFIGWVIYNVFVKPAIYKIRGAKRSMIGSPDPFDQENDTKILGGWKLNSN